VPVIAWILAAALVAAVLVALVLGIAFRRARARAAQADELVSDARRAIRAAAEEREGALLVGIDIRRLYALAFGIGCGVVAIAGSLVAPFLYVAPDVGDVFNILAFVIVVLGGMGSFAGALAGGFVVGLAESLGAAVLPGSLKQLPIFVLFVLILLFRPTGLSGRRAA
jgi:branched-chain amino acid transport system permease protein